MKKAFLLISSVVLFASTALAQNPTRRPMTIDDVLNMVRIGNVLMSPDGKQVFYGKTELDWDKNKRKTTYYMVSADGGEPRQYIGEAGGDSFQFSPDGKHLSFLRKHEEHKQLFVMLTEGGEASRYTSHPGGISSYKWSGDGKRIFFSAEETLSEEEQKEHDLGADPIFIDEGPNGKKEGHWNNLWAFDIATRKELRITNEELLFRSFDVSPDGERIVLSARLDDRVNYPFLAELYMAQVSSGRVTRLTDNMAPERNPLWAPDGKTFVYRAPSDADFYLTNGYFWIMNPDTGETRKLEGQTQGEVSQVTWMPDGKSILFNEVQRTNSNLYRMNVTTGEVTALTDVTGTLNALSFSRDRQRMVYSFSDFTTPEDLYVTEAGGLKPVRLTNANPWIEEEYTPSALAITIQNSLPCKLVPIETISS